MPEQIALDEFGKQMLERLVATISERNEKVGLLKAAQGDSQSLLEALRDSSDDPEVQALTAQIEALDEQRENLFQQRDALLKPVVEARLSAGSENVEEEVAKVDALDKTIRSGRTYLVELYGEDVVKDLPALVGRKNRSASGGGEGTGRRIRGFDIYVNGTLATSRDSKGVERSNFSAAAKAVGVDTATLQEAFFQAQGTKEAKDFKDRVEFNVTVGEGDEAKTHTVVAKRLSEEQTPQGPADVADDSAA